MYFLICNFLQNQCTLCKVQNNCVEIWKLMCFPKWLYSINVYWYWTKIFLIVWKSVFFDTLWKDFFLLQALSLIDANVNNPTIFGMLYFIQFMMFRLLSLKFFISKSIFTGYLLCCVLNNKKYSYMWTYSSQLIYYKR